MDCRKFGKEEIEAWSALFEDGYDGSPLHGELSERAYRLLESCWEYALDEDFELMHECLQMDCISLARYMKIDAFASRVKRLYEHGVACGDAASCCNLGNLYHDTEGTASPEQYERAIELYERGMELGDVQAAINLGYIFYYGRGVQRDYRRAYECYVFGALLGGHPEGYWKLGDLYAFGNGVRQSDWVAWLLYKKAHEAAGPSPLSARAAHHMADYLLMGIEGLLDPNPDAALRLYNEAEVGYYQLIDEGLAYYARQLEQVVEGQQRARDAARETHRKLRLGE